jgi:hypothetical protein
LQHYPFRVRRPADECRSKPNRLPFIIGFAPACIHA